MTKIIRERPDYYDSFTCTGNTTCIDICCYAWVLPMDPETAEFYLNYEGEFGDYLRENIFQEENGDWFIRLKDHGRCPFLTEDKLCSVRLHDGEKAQIKICDIYPREQEVMAGHYRQDRILIACSEVARLLYTSPGDAPLFIRTEEEADIEVSEELKVRTERLLAFRDGLMKALVAGSFDDSLFGCYESPKEMEKLLDDALYFEGHDVSQQLFVTLRSILPQAGKIRAEFYEKVPEAKKWLRKTAAYFAHRQLLDTIQDGSIDGPLISVFRSVHLLELICLTRFYEKGSFDLDDMIFSAHIFGLIFEISMHNVALMKEVRNTAQDAVYPDGENSLLRPYLYP
ncbi:MAG: flagellin lysine-N-methylase [Lachnospiraceae bacterium]|nr:flagellin lysine-N-methylase [Lachnospiraceae bacterium]